jgi:predicted nucleic acid-binding protein
MNVVDSSGWLEFFTKGPNATVFAPVIKNVDELLVPTIIVYEVFKRILLQVGEEGARTVATAMRQGRVIELDLIVAVTAATLSASLKLPMADSIILATARVYQATLWTQDADFKGMTGVRYIEKPPPSP